MALTRSKSLKAKKYGTPSAPSPSATPKAPSPRATGGITQIATGQTVQEQFKTKVQTLTAPIRNVIRTLTTRAEALEKEGGGRSPDLGARADAIIVRKQIEE